MIRIFKQAGKKALEGGKLKNYLTYAIGEIVLVVVGILIALQINTWSEERKERQLEQDYYCRLQEDLQQDELLLARLNEENESRIRSSNELIHLLQQKAPSRKEVVIQLRAATSKTTFTFKPNQAAYEDLKSSGNLNVLKDMPLKTQLVNYHSLMAGLTDVVDVNSRATIAMYYDIRKNFAELGWQDIPSIAEVLDTTLVDTRPLQSAMYPSPELRKALLSEAIFYLGTNSRKRELYKLISPEITRMKDALARKCPAAAISER